MTLTRPNDDRQPRREGNAASADAPPAQSPDDHVFGASLRRLYDDMLSEPLPREMQDILDKLE
ncbi:MAG: NepR family anti-sigma factor [Pseudomonadota bacterium]